MHFRQVDIANIVGGIVVADLATGPVYTFDFDLSRTLLKLCTLSSGDMYVLAYDFVVLDGAAYGIIGMPSVLDQSAVVD